MRTVLSAWCVAYQTAPCQQQRMNSSEDSNKGGPSLAQEQHSTLSTSSNLRAWSRPSGEGGHDRCSHGKKLNTSSVKNGLRHNDMMSNNTAQVSLTRKEYENKKHQDLRSRFSSKLNDSEL